MQNGCIRLTVQMLFVFQSTLHSSQSSRVRFMSHPAASTPGNYRKSKFLLVKKTPDKDLQVKSILCVLTFEKWVENCVHQLVTLMHHFPVTFKKKKRKVCIVEKKRENPSVNVKKLMEVKAHFAVVHEVLWKSTCF